MVSVFLNDCYKKEENMWQRPHVAHKAWIFTIWPFTAEVCPLAYSTTVSVSPVLHMCCKSAQRPGWLMLPHTCCHPTEAGRRAWWTMPQLLKHLPPTVTCYVCLDFSCQSKSSLTGWGYIPPLERIWVNSYIVFHNYHIQEEMWLIVPAGPSSKELNRRLKCITGRW